MTLGAWAWNGKWSLPLWHQMVPVRGNIVGGWSKFLLGECRTQNLFIRMKLDVWKLSTCHTRTKSHEVVTSLFRFAKSFYEFLDRVESMHKGTEKSSVRDFLLIPQPDSPKPLQTYQEASIKVSEAVKADIGIRHITHAYMYLRVILAISLQLLYLPLHCEPRQGSDHLGNNDFFILLKSWLGKYISLWWYHFSGRSPFLSKVLPVSKIHWIWIDPAWGNAGYWHRCDIQPRPPDSVPFISASHECKTVTFPSSQSF